MFAALTGVFALIVSCAWPGVVRSNMAACIIPKKCGGKSKNAAARRDLHGGTRDAPSKGRSGQHKGPQAPTHSGKTKGPRPPSHSGQHNGPRPPTHSGKHKGRRPAYHSGRRAPGSRGPIAAVQRLELGAAKDVRSQLDQGAAIALKDEEIFRLRAENERLKADKHILASRLVSIADGKEWALACKLAYMPVITAVRHKLRRAIAELAN